jgi:hypothetical protein
MKYNFIVKKIEGKTGIQVECILGDKKSVGHWFVKEELDEDIKRTLIGIFEKRQK